MGKDNFILYSEQEQLFNQLNDTQAGKLIKAIFEYEKTGKIPKLSPLSNMAFVTIKASLDRNREKYQKVVERNKQNGKLGGRPKTEKNPKNPDGYFGNPKKPKKADNDNEPDNEPDSEQDNDTDEVLAEVVKYYEDNIGLLVPATATILIDLKEKHSKELIKEAIDICCKRNIRTMDYLDGILRQWEAKGIKTLGDVKNERINKKKNVDKSTLGIKSFDELYDN